VIFYKKFFSQKKVEAVQTQNVPTQVNVIQIKIGDISIMQEWPARIIPYKFAEIRPQIEGVIVSRLFREGAYVKQGQPLYKIDPAEKIIIKAPISGYIGRSFLTDGALVTKGQLQPLAIITQLEQMYADITIPSNIINEVKKNKNAKVTLIVNEEEYAHEGEILFSEVSLDQSTDSITVRALFPNPEETLISGEMVLAKIDFPQESVITVPQRVTERSQSGELSVWVINHNNTIRKQVIESTRAIGSDWVVSSGLLDGDLVVYEGMQKINPQSTVEPILVSRFTGEKIAQIVPTVPPVEQKTELEQTMETQEIEEQATPAKNNTEVVAVETAAAVAQKMAKARDLKDSNGLTKSEIKKVKAGKKEKSAKKSKKGKVKKKVTKKNKSNRLNKSNNKSQSSKNKA